MKFYKNQLTNIQAITQKKCLWTTSLTTMSVPYHNMIANFLQLYKNQRVNIKCSIHSYPWLNIVYTTDRVWMFIQQQKAITAEEQLHINH